MTRVQSNPVLKTMQLKSTLKQRISHSNSLSRHSSSSPFTAIFQIIYDNATVKLETSEEGGEQNPYYCPDLVNMLMNRFMPYVFIWSGLVLRGTGKSRWTNGYIEAYFRTKKTHGLHSSPANYVLKTFKCAKGEIIQYVDKNPITAKKRKLLEISKKNGN